METDSIKVITIILISAIFLVAALPLKNYLEIKYLKKQDDFWKQWVNELPSKERLLQQMSSQGGLIECHYCGSNRLYPSLEMVIKSIPKFGVINNSYGKYTYFKAYICTRCGTQVYRERYEE